MPTELWRARFKFFLVDQELFIVSLQTLENWSNKQNIGVQHEKAPPWWQKEWFQLSKADPEIGLACWERLYVPRLLQFTRVKITTTLILDQIDIDLRIPKPNAGDENAREVKITSVATDANGINFHALYWP